MVQSLRRSDTPAVPTQSQDELAAISSNLLRRRDSYLFPVCSSVPCRIGHGRDPGRTLVPSHGLWYGSVVTG